MPLGTPRALFTKPLVVILASRQSRTLLDVQIQTLIPVLAVPVGVVELALVHLPHVVLVQEVAARAFLAERFQPVLAHVGFCAAGVRPVLVGRGLRWRWVAIWTAPAKRTVACEIGRAYRRRRNERCEAVGAEEGAKRECVRLRLSGAWWIGCRVVFTCVRWQWVECVVTGEYGISSVCRRLRKDCCRGHAGTICCGGL